jgi:DNA helicase HerA-like ATPase
MKVNIDMGLAGRAVAEMDLEELLATRLLVQGNSGSGKSHLLRRLLEQSAPWVQQCIIDPEGDFVTLADRFGHQVVDAARTEAELTRIAGRVRQHRVSVVLNLEGLDVEQQMRAAAAFLGGMFDAEREHWYPMLVVVDEAQLFAPAVAGEVSDEARKLSLGAMTNLMCRGRKRGLAGVIATQRLAKLAKNVAAEASNFLMGRTFLDIDMARAADLLGMDRRQAEQFRELARGHFVALGPALSRRPLPITIGPVETSARSSSPKLMPLPEATEDARGLRFVLEPARASAGASVGGIHAGGLDAGRWFGGAAGGRIPCAGDSGPLPGPPGRARRSGLKGARASALRAVFAVYAPAWLRSQALTPATTSGARCLRGATR